MTQDQTEIAGDNIDLESMKRADLPVIWDGFKAQVEKLKATAETLVVTSTTQVAEMKLARETRLTLKSLRVDIDKRRKSLGEEALRRKQGIDESARQLREIIEPLEARLLEQETFAERQAAQELQAKIAAREEQLRPFWIHPYAMPDQRTLTDEQFGGVLARAKSDHAEKIETERKEAQAKADKEKADREEQERIRLENARLRAESLEREQAIVKERQAREAAERKVREQDELAARKKRDAEIAKARAEREEEKAKRKAAAAPDKEKLAAFIGELQTLPIPELSTIEGKGLGLFMRSEISKLALELQKQLESL